MAVDLSPRRGHRFDVQALRGAAVLLVVLYHCGIEPRGGFIGVDVFFVLSGFVIGRLVVEELVERDRLSLRAFFTRRARRLMPALAALLVVTVLAAPLLAPLGASDATPRTAVAAALFSANLYLHRTTGGGYFTPAAELNPLLHTWSLSVEEQFYFAVPLLLVGAWALGRRRRRSIAALRWTVAGVGVVSFAANLWFTHGTEALGGPRFAFFLPVTRAWEFLVGFALVLLPGGVARRLRTGATPVRVLGWATVLVAAVAFDDATTFPGIAAVAPVVGTAMVLLAGTADADRDPGATAPWRPLVRLGDLSYSWYLWHWPAITFAAALLPGSGAAVAVAAALGSLVPAVASHRWLEHRFRSAPGVARRPTPVLAVTCMVVPVVAVVVAAGLGAWVDGRVGDRGPDEIDRQHVGAAEGCHGSGPLERRWGPTCTWGAGRTGLDVVLVGDSNAQQYGEALIEAADREGAVLRIGTSSACPLVDFDARPATTLVDLSSDCRRSAPQTLAFLEQHPPDVVVVANATDRYGPAAIEPVLGSAIRRLQRAGAKVVVISVLPKPRTWDTHRCAALRWWVEPEACLPTTFDPADDTIHAAALAAERRVVASTGADLWSFEQDVCRGGRCESRHDGALVWRDEGHISVTESQRLADRATELLGRSSDGLPG